MPLQDEKGSRTTQSPVGLELTGLLISIPKRGELHGDCEDAGHICEPAGRFALSDGATESYMPRAWAEILSTFACQNGLPRADEDLKDWLRVPQKQWWQRRLARLQDPAAPYWQQDADPKRLAAATLVALEVDTVLAGDTFSWRAFAIGDSCCFLLRAGALIEKFPCQRREDFGYRPACLFSGATTTTATVDQPVWIDGLGQLGDIFFLATDALAEWIFCQLEAEVAPWQRLLSIRDRAELDEFAAEERAQNRMRNDDVTLLVIRTTESRLIVDSRG